jgi:hypothetical protein
MELAQGEHKKIEQSDADTKRKNACFKNRKRGAFAKKYLERKPARSKQERSSGQEKKK